MQDCVRLCDALICIGTADSLSVSQLHFVFCHCLCLIVAHCMPVLLHQINKDALDLQCGDGSKWSCE